MTGWNEGVIEEFRANGGKLGGRWEGRTLLLLHHRGARSGTVRVNPLAYKDLGDGRVAIFASKGGSDTNPDWYHNVRANPSVRIEIRAEVRDGLARVAEGEERTRIWEAIKRELPGFATYEQRTDREIPVIVIEPAE